MDDWSGLALRARRSGQGWAAGLAGGGGGGEGRVKKIKVSLEMVCARPQLVEQLQGDGLLLANRVSTISDAQDD